VHTLGCRANQSDSEQLAEILTGGGFQQVAVGTRADVQIVNTCTVTREADRKSAQMVRRAERLGGQVVATGCGVAARGGLKGVGASTLRLPPDQREEILSILGAENCPSTANLEREGLRQKRHRALLRIQEGCDQFCTFCIVPYVRGRARSYPFGKVLQEVLALQKTGYREIVLTGIHLSSYQVEEGDLAGLLEFLIVSTQEVRFRLSSVEPDLFPRALFALMVAHPDRLCPYLHLVLQHASDAVLERMHRGYDLAHYDALVQEFFEVVAGACLTSDIMVGFPGETDEDFEALMGYVARTPYYHLHVFPYSMRPGTAAAKFSDQIAAPLKQARRDRLIALTAKKKREFQRRSLGQTRHVLVEECAPSRGWVQGTADNYMAVRLRGGAALIGQTVQVTLHRIRQEWVYAGFPQGTAG
jgi:threonylcarbamoyladenosine tRNA methylthiotransferase MtaB